MCFAQQLAELYIGHVGDPGNGRQGVSSYHVGVVPFGDCRHECDGSKHSSKVLTLTLAQSVELLGEVGPRCASV